ncbi:protein required for cell viability [Fonsecaea monophora]|uniref:Protein required for cell viability n=1 Tax=Fonsecaea monophora TaxID=254056 RepID=A0A177FDA3_9EURO|nr:protein required for cell viability [Fonsecaea monophora]OAG42245.1 protein required for cell viability [Fonsecaea monophora]
MFGTFRYDKTRESATSLAERKRTRDRQAQQKLRERRIERIQRLEEQVALCEQRHGQAMLEPLLERVGDLELENKTLNERWQKLFQAFSSARHLLTQAADLLGEHMVNGPPLTQDASQHVAVGEDGAIGDNLAMAPSITVPNGASASLLQLTDLICAPSTLPLLSHGPDSDGATDLVVNPGSNPCSGHVAPDNADSRILEFTPTSIERWRASFIESCDSSSGPLVGEPGGVPDQEGSVFQAAQRPTPKESELTRASGPDFRQDRLSGVGSMLMPMLGPPWASLPNSGLEDSLNREFLPWFMHPQAIVASPRLPDPSHLLFGSKTNFLADEVHTALRKSRVAEPERLAKGWLIYVYSKWRVCPTKESFELIPAFMRPTREQLVFPHQAIFDLITWPAIRLALIRQGTPNGGFAEIFSAMACCAKVRWPWGKEILETSETNELSIRPDFFQVFTQLEGWGLTSEFIRSYGHLLEDMDPESYVYNVL